VKNVLFVDDNLGELEPILHRIEFDERIRLHAAASPAIALRKYEEEQFKVDLLITDLRLPNMANGVRWNSVAGIEFAGLVRDTAGDIPVIFITAVVDPEILEQASKIGPVFQKPLKGSELMEEVRLCLEIA